MLSESGDRNEYRMRFWTSSFLPMAHFPFHCFQGQEGTFVLHNNARVHLRMNTIHQDHEPEVLVYLQSNNTTTMQLSLALIFERIVILRTISKSDQNLKGIKNFIRTRFISLFYTVMHLLIGNESFEQKVMSKTEASKQIVFTVSRVPTTWAAFYTFECHLRKHSKNTNRSLTCCHIPNGTTLMLVNWTPL